MNTTLNTTLFANNIKKDLKAVEEYLAEYIDFPHTSLRLSSQHMLRAGGKRIRPAFVLLSGKVYRDTPDDYLISLAAAVELVHMATLVHDDVIDQSELRRGKATIRSIWGDKFSLHSGDYLFAQALRLIEPKKNPQIASILSKVSVEMCQGEIRQLVSTFNTQETIRDYFYRIKRKTALLIAVSCQIGALAVSAPSQGVRALTRYGHYLGMAFQIKDDVLDLSADAKTIGKPVGSDLLQGIITLPAILVLQDQRDYSTRLRSLIEGRFSTGGIEEALEIIKSQGGTERALKISENFINKAKRELQLLPQISVTANLAKLADYINEREL